MKRTMASQATCRHPEGKGGPVLQPEPWPSYQSFLSFLQFPCPTAVSSQCSGKVKCESGVLVDVMGHLSQPWAGFLTSQEESELNHVLPDRAGFGASLV